MATLAAAGLSVAVVGGALIVRPKSRITPRLRSLILDYKSQLVSVLEDGVATTGSTEDRHQSPKNSNKIDGGLRERVAPFEDRQHGGLRDGSTRPEGLVHTESPDHLSGRLCNLDLGEPLLVSPHWGAEEWRCFFDERAGIRQFDGSMAKEQAEREAYGDTVAEYLNRVPPPVISSDTCRVCGRILECRHGNVIAVLEPGRHVWLHRECHKHYLHARHDEAATALAAMGLVSP
jgi:hypothetical protein